MPANTAPPAGAALDVAVVYAAPGVESIVHLTLPAGAVVADAVQASGLLDLHSLDPRRLAFAIYGERVAPGVPLARGDRVELTRPLQADPKAARRDRAAARPLPRPRPKAKRRSQAAG